MDPNVGLADGRGNLVSQIIQVALGLFVTTVDLPSLSSTQISNNSLNYDCAFDGACRWGSVGRGTDKWKWARGQPDSLLWLAGTGTTTLPTEPFAIIETHSDQADMLVSNQISCQIESAMFSFTYWMIGNADLQICLLDQLLRQFNCTGMLQARIQPGRVALKIPPIKHPFHIAIIPDVRTGVLIVDDLKYDADLCRPNGRTPSPPIFTTHPLPPFESLPSPEAVTPASPDEASGEITETEEPTARGIIRITAGTATFPTISTTIPSTTTTTATTTTTEETTTAETTTESTTQQTTTTTATTTTTEETTTEETKTTTEFEPQFDLLIVGNRTQPMFDRRRGRILDDTQDLLCDFSINFPCYWGAEAGKWAIIEKGAIPSLEEAADGRTELPSYPAAVVIQGTAMFASDPIRCQTGAGKLMFRYWSNNKIAIQVCALGYNLDSNKIQCAEQHMSERTTEVTLAVFELAKEIPEAFTLNIVPIWERNVKNGYLVLDEIAYMGECNSTLLEESAEIEEKRTRLKIPDGNGRDFKPKQVKPSTTTPANNDIRITARRGMATRRLTSTTTTTPSGPSEESESEEAMPTEDIEESTTLSTATLQPNVATVTLYPGLIVQRTTLKNSFTIPYTTTPRFLTTTTEAALDYCKLLNCDFNENACRYLNHGLTKVPWTLRNKGYGFPLSRHTDLRPTLTSGQFVSTILGPGDFAILESPRFNLTQGINVLLFQYYRPTHSSTIRLCLGTRYTKPLRTVSAFIQCPPILRSLTSKNAFKWNSVHIQLPPGTTHFYLVAHNLDRSTEKAAIAIDNIRVAICDPRSYDAPAGFYASDNFDPGTDD